MKLKNFSRTPPGGWTFTDPETKDTIMGASYLDLMSNVIHGRVSKKVDLPANLGQMIQDQICDRAGKDWCEGFGLGDAVHAIAQPIAAAIDKLAGTDIKGCSACAKRRASLNS